MGVVTTDKPKKLINNIKINPHDYYCDPDKTPKRAIRREIVIVDDTTPVMIDSARLMQVFTKLIPRDLQYYFYILSLMRDDNNHPIAVSNFDMRNHFKIKYVEQVAMAMKRLEIAGLLFKLPNKYGQYIVNPAFAWIGDRTQYFDANSLELMKPKPQEEQ